MRKIEDALIKSSIQKAVDLLGKNELKLVLGNKEKINLDDSSTIDGIAKTIKEQLYLFVEEFAPINILFNINNNNIPEISATMNTILYGTYQTNILPPKDKKIKELYNICVFVGPVDGKVTYKNVNNIESEVLRILNKTKFIPLKTFFTNIGFSSNFAKEFLSINENVANMFKNKRIMLFSALLNYSWSIINTEIRENTTFADILETEELLPQAYKTEANWTELSTLFKLFLDQLWARTIHYE